MDIINSNILYVELLISWRLQGHVYSWFVWIKTRKPLKLILIFQENLRAHYLHRTSNKKYLVAPWIHFEVVDLLRVLKSAVNEVLGNYDSRGGVRTYICKWLMSVCGNQWLINCSLPKRLESKERKNVCI